MNYVSTTINGKTVVHSDEKELPRNSLKRFVAVVVSFVLGFASGYLFNVYF